LVIETSQVTLLRFRRQDVKHWTATYLTIRIPRSNTTKGTIGRYVAPQQARRAASEQAELRLCPIEGRGVQLSSRPQSVTNRTRLRPRRRRPRSHRLRFRSCRYRSSPAASPRRRSFAQSCRPSDRRSRPDPGAWRHRYDCWTSRAIVARCQQPTGRAFNGSRLDGEARQLHQPREDALLTTSGAVPV
jgi:hypothetical protein